MELITILETGGAVALTIGVLEGIKRLEYVSAKFIPLIGLVVGILICWLGSAGGVLAIEGTADIIWYGLMTGLMSCGLFSGTKNILS